MNKTILRVQNRHGHGPYTGHGDFSFHLRHNLDTPGHPSPVCDPGIARWMNGYERCGFIDENQLAEWFSADDILEMCSEGFWIEEIENADITAVGHKQILFALREN